MEVEEPCFFRSNPLPITPIQGNTLFLISLMQTNISYIWHFIHMMSIFYSPLFSDHDSCTPFLPFKSSCISSSLRIRSRFVRSEQIFPRKKGSMCQAQVSLYLNIAYFSRNLFWFFHLDDFFDVLLKQFGREDKS